jgi:hypothetical protein
MDMDGINRHRQSTPGAEVEQPGADGLTNGGGGPHNNQECCNNYQQAF